MRALTLKQKQRMVPVYEPKPPTQEDWWDMYIASDLGSEQASLCLAKIRTTGPGLSEDLDEDE